MVIEQRIIASLVDTIAGRIVDENRLVYSANYSVPKVYGTNPHGPLGVGIYIDFFIGDRIETDIGV